MIEQTRTGAIMEAIRAQLEQRRVLIDQATDLGRVTITIRLQARTGGRSLIKSVRWEEERICWTRPM